MTADSEVSGGYSRVIKSRLQKKLDVFVNQELPVLVEKGYLDVTEFRSVTENRNNAEIGSSLVRIPLPISGNNLEISDDYRAKNMKKEKKWAGQDLNSRATPCQGN